MYADLVMLQSQLQTPAMAFQNMIGQMGTSQRVGLPMSSYNPYASSTMNQQQYLLMQAQNRLMGLTTPQARTTNTANTSSTQVIELD